MPNADNAEKLLALITGPNPAATLSGNPADDAYAISAGTGQKISPGSGGSVAISSPRNTILVGGSSSSPTLDVGSSVATGTPPASAWQLIQWTLVQNFTLLSATRNTSEVITTASVLWPDGATGTFTPTTINATFNTIDAFTITYVWTNAGGGTHTITQTAVTRDASGAVTAQPTPTVA